MSALSATAALFLMCVVAVRAVRLPCKYGECVDGAGRIGWCTPAQVDNSDRWPQHVGHNGECNAHAPSRGVEDTPSEPLLALGVLSILVSSFVCHVQSPSIYSELPCHLREPAACRLLSATAFSILLLLKLVLGACGYVAFGAQTQGDVLNNFAETDAMIGGLRVAVTVLLVLVFSKSHHPARLVLHRQWHAIIEKTSPAAEDMSTTFTALSAALFVATVTVCALIIGNDIVFASEFFSGLTVSVLVLLLPAGLLYRIGGSKALIATFVVAGAFVGVCGPVVAVLNKVRGD